MLSRCNSARSTPSAPDDAILAGLAAKPYLHIIGPA